MSLVKQNPKIKYKFFSIMVKNNNEITNNNFTHYYKVMFYHKS